MRKIFITDIDLEISPAKYTLIRTPQDLSKHFSNVKAVVIIKDNQIKKFVKEISNIFNFDICKLEFGDKITACYFIQRNFDDFEIYMYEKVEPKIVYEH